MLKNKLQPKIIRNLHVKNPSAKWDLFVLKNMHTAMGYVFCITLQIGSPRIIVIKKYSLACIS